ncbi:MAG: hypothetical protein HN348_03470, partial [Proteobacteria bacterium]|nr:hypothetical protein [Pseudomonadota bacterium]
MRCERCEGSFADVLVCPSCGTEKVERRLRYRRRMGLTIDGWHDDGVLTDEVHQSLVGRLDVEKRALREPNRAPSPSRAEPVLETVVRTKCPTPLRPMNPFFEAAGPTELHQQKPKKEPPSPRIPPKAVPFSVPGVHGHGNGSRTFEVVGRFLRERIGWATGVVLTVVGSVYMAGMVWEGLPALWRHLLLLGFLAAYAAGFSWLGLRIGRQPGGDLARRWLCAVGAALMPVHGMAVAGLWEVSTIAAVGSLLLLAPLDYFLLRWTHRWPAVFRLSFLAVALSVGLLGIEGLNGAQWLLLPALGCFVATWSLCTDKRRVSWSSVVLLGFAYSFHLMLAPLSTLWAYSPLVALGALGMLYVDAAMGRWRGVRRIRLNSLRGVATLVLMLVALGLTLPTFAPLPTGWNAALTYVIAIGVFAGATSSWRRPGLWFGLLGALLLVQLTIPDLFATIIDPLRQQARSALGYRHQPLPLAWYAMTLLPYVVFCRWLALRLKSVQWRQRDILSRYTWYFAVGLAGLLLVVSHSKMGDLRPALVALPVYGLLWFRQKKAWQWLWGTLPALGLITLAVDVVFFFAMPGWAGLLLVGGTSFAILAAHGALESWIGDAKGTLFVVGLAPFSFLVVTGGVTWLALLAWGLLWWCFSMRLLQRGDEATPLFWSTKDDRLLATSMAIIGSALSVAGLLWLGVELKWGVTEVAWCMTGLSVLSAALGFLLNDGWESHRRVAFSWAHILFAVVVCLRFALDNPHRTLIELPLAGLLFFAMRRTSSPWYGLVLILGLVEGVARRLIVHTYLPWESVATIAVVVTWLPCVLATKQWPGGPGVDMDWLRRSLLRPSRWMGWFVVGIAAVLHLYPLITAGGWALISAAGLVALVWLASRWCEGLTRELVVGTGFLLLVLFGSLAGFSTPVVLAVLVVALAVLAGLKGDVWVAGSSLALLVTTVGVGVFLGPIGGGFWLLLAAAVAVALRALRSAHDATIPWAEAAYLSWIALGLLALCRFFGPGAEWYFLALTGAVFTLVLVSFLANYAGMAARRLLSPLLFPLSFAWALYGVLYLPELTWEPLPFAACSAMLVFAKNRHLARLMVPWVLVTALVALNGSNLVILWSLVAFAVGHQAFFPREHWYNRSLIAVAALALLAVPAGVYVAPLWMVLAALLCWGGMNWALVWVGVGLTVATATIHLDATVLETGGWLSWVGVAIAFLGRDWRRDSMQWWFKALVAVALVATAAINGPPWALVFTTLFVVVGLVLLGRFGHELPYWRPIRHGALTALLVMGLVGLPAPADVLSPLILGLVVVALLAVRLKNGWLVAVALPAIACNVVDHIPLSFVETMPFALIGLAATALAGERWLPMGRWQTIWFTLLAMVASFVGFAVGWNWFVLAGCAGGISLLWLGQHRWSLGLLCGWVALFALAQGCLPESGLVVVVTFACVFGAWFYELPVAGVLLRLVLFAL